MKMKTFTWSLTGLILFLICISFNAQSDRQVAEKHNSKEDAYQKYFSESYKIFALETPEEFSFAGEKMPLELHDVKERLDRELHVNTYWQSQTLLLHKRANRWFPIIEPILREEGVPDDFKYLAVAESGLTQAVSPAGAAGFWQFLKGTARSYDLEVREGVDERYHIEESTHAACRYLKERYAHYGTWTLAAASYNYGQANVDKQLARQSATDYYDLLLNEETARYMFRLSAMKIILEQPMSYGFHFRPSDLYAPYNTVNVEVDSAITNMAAFAAGFGLSYKDLKTLNPWLRENHLTNRNKTQYLIKLPSSDETGFGLASEHYE